MEGGRGAGEKLDGGVAKEKRPKKDAFSIDLSEEIKEDIEL